MGPAPTAAAGRRRRPRATARRSCVVRAHARRRRGPPRARGGPRPRAAAGRRVLARGAARGAHASLRVERRRTCSARCSRHTDLQALGAPDEAARAAVAPPDADCRAAGRATAPTRSPASTPRGSRARAPPSRCGELRFEATADGRLRWALTAVPCAPYAARRDHEAAFADLLYAAAGCDVGGPDRALGASRRGAGRAPDRLEAGCELRFVGPGTDVTLSAWPAGAGAPRRPTATCPTARSSPVRCEDSAEGVVSFAAVPTLRGGRRVAGVRLALRARRGRRGHRGRGRGRAAARRWPSTRARAGWARSASARTTRCRAPPA